MNHIGPSGLQWLLWIFYPDLTVGAISWRRFAPHPGSIELFPRQKFFFDISIKLLTRPSKLHSPNLRRIQQSEWPNAFLSHAGEPVLSSSQPSFRRDPVGIV